MQLEAMMFDYRAAASASRARKHRPGLALVALAVGAVLAGCAGDTSARAQPKGVEFAGGDIPEVLATVGDEPITLMDVRARAGDELDRIEIQYRRDRYQAVNGALEAILRERMLAGEAARRGMALEQLIAEEAGQDLEPTEVEIATWYEDNRGRLGRRTLDQVRSQITEHLRAERRNEAVRSLEDRLASELGVVVHLEPFRIEFDNSRAPALGPENAPVTLVEFSDFQCPFCQRFAPTLHQLEQTFGDQLRIVYRHFPLTNIHPFAFKAAEASMCADEQGQFWPMHDLILQEPNRMSVSDLKEKARRVGLDQRRFDGCLDSGRFAELVQSDFLEGQRAGVTGTPALFINGVRLEGGAVPFETVADAVRKELARHGR